MGRSALARAQYYRKDVQSSKHLSRFVLKIMSVEDPSDRVADKILEIARGLCLLLDIPVIYLKSLAWTDSTRYLKGGGRIVPSDQCLILPPGDLILAKRMRGRLTPDEWRPIIASALIYEKKLAPRLRGKALANIVLPLIASYVALGVGFALSKSLWVGLLFLSIPIATLLPGFKRFTPYQKRARLQADLQTTKLVDRDFFLEVLTKIYSSGMKDVEKREEQAARGRISEIPSISERLDNLRSRE